MIPPGKDREETVIVNFEDASLGYGRKTILENLNFSIMRGDFLGIIGPNGSGKTTILRSILGSVRPGRGRITVSPGLQFGYVIQRQHLDTLFPLTVYQVVEMGRYARLGMLRRLDRKDKELIYRCLEIVGIKNLGNEGFRNLSGGQKQRALLARALASEPDIMLLDEPTNDLDISGETMVMDLIHEIHHNWDITVIMVSHLLHVVLNHVDTIMFLGEGKISIHPISEVVERGFLSRIYGVNVKVNVIDGKRVIVME